MPDTEKRRAELVQFNGRIMAPLPEFENESVRARRRDLKEKYKACLVSHEHQANFLPINPFLEDFYHLVGLSKAGSLTQSTKKGSSFGQAYKHLFAQGSTAKIENLNIDKVRLKYNVGQPQNVASLVGKKMGYAEIKASRNSATGDFSSNSAANLSMTNDTATSNGKIDEYALESCQISEIQQSIYSTKE